MLQWLMDDAEGEEKAVRALVMRILTVNFAAIHTSSMVCFVSIYILRKTAHGSIELYACASPSGGQPPMDGADA